MILRMRDGRASVSSKSSISASRDAVSSTRFRIYSRLMLRSLISATYSAWIWSMPKPIIRFGTTSASFSVSRMILMALSMSSRIFLRPFKRCSLSCRFLSMKYTRRLTLSVRHAHHSSKSSRTPITRGMPPIRTLKLHDAVSCSVVALKSFCISLSGSAPRFKSIVSLRPERSVSSRMSEISLTLPALMSSATLSMMASVVVV